MNSEPPALFILRSYPTSNVWLEGALDRVSRPTGNRLCASGKARATVCSYIAPPRALPKASAGIFNIMDGNNNLVANGEATTADFRETDSRKCPIAGVSQTWSSFKKDLAFWKIQCSLDKSTIAAHVVNRGFARN